MNCIQSSKHSGMGANPDRWKFSGPTPANFPRFPARCRRLVASAGQAAIALACGGSLFLDSVKAADPSPHNNLPPSVLSVDGGFTRETLMEFDAPEPAPFAPVPTASVQSTDESTRAYSAARRRRHTRRHRQVAKSPAAVVVVKAAPRRNPVSSFVYWWNGWVIRTFHTKIGTVMLDKIGAKT